MNYGKNQNFKKSAIFGKLHDSWEVYFSKKNPDGGLFFVGSCFWGVALGAAQKFQLHVF